tara:strand:- start:209 stop:1594 length:1386 start_codon:yes stop_codon:yes gene_type:complete
MKYYYLIFISILCSCDNFYKDKSIFIGGNIINPSSKFVLLYKNEEMIDTIFLDQENKFSERFFDLSPGVYKLEHPPKNESIFIEHGDSIWTRVNTADFNASISFSGIGSGKNNYLIKNKNQIRDEISFLSSKYSLDPLFFSNIIDSLLDIKNQNWKKFDSLSKLSLLGKKITQSSYIYPYANRKERYYLIRGGSNIIQDKSKFLNFRKKLNYEEDELYSFEPYIKYLLSYINNIVINSDKNYSKTMSETSFNLNRLKVVDSTINSKKLRSTLFRSIAYEELINFKNHKNHKKFIDFFSKFQNGSENHINEIKSLYNSISLMQKGEKLPTIELEDTNFNKIKSNLIFDNKPTVIYFWSQTQMNYFKNTYKVVSRFKKKYPNYRYIGICIQPFNSLVLNFQRDSGILSEDQYAMINFENGSKKWVLTLLNKGLIVDENQVIKEGFGVFTSNNFESILQEFHKN